MGAMMHTAANSTIINILTDHISKKYLCVFS